MLFQPLPLERQKQCDAQAVQRVATLCADMQAGKGLHAVSAPPEQSEQLEPPGVAVHSSPACHAGSGQVQHLQAKPPALRQWDIFCRVIDNYGDIGVCWRLACDLAQRGQHVRLWVDDASALRWLAPSGCAGVQVLPWPDEAICAAGITHSSPQYMCAQVWAKSPPDVLIEAFGCELPQRVQQQWAALLQGDTQTAAAAADAQGAQHSERGDGLFQRQPLPDNALDSLDAAQVRGSVLVDAPPQTHRQWLNLEYLSAEDWSRRCHLLASPVLSGAAQGCTKRFFYPGMVAGTGGLLREPDLPDRQHAHAALLQGWQHAASAQTDVMRPPSPHQSGQGRADAVQHVASTPRTVAATCTSGREQERTAVPAVPNSHTLLNQEMALQWQSARADTQQRPAAMPNQPSMMESVPACPSASAHPWCSQPINQPIDQPINPPGSLSAGTPTRLHPDMSAWQLPSPVSAHMVERAVARQPSTAVCHAVAQDWAELAVLAPTAHQVRISLFCYEPAALPDLLAQAQQCQAALLVTPGRAWAAVQRCVYQVDATSCGGSDGDIEATSRTGHTSAGACMGGADGAKGERGARLSATATIIALPWLSQRAFDALLWSCHLNCVRGEDSLVRALWAGQALLWHIYPQHDDAHHAKLAAFLDWLDAPADLRHWHWAWNGALHAPEAAAFRAASLPALTPQRLCAWQECVLAARARLMQQDDLCTQLMQL